MRCRHFNQTWKSKIWPQIASPERVELALCWNQPPGSLNHFPNLKLISSFGAGVDHLLNDPHIPPDIPIVRLVDPDLRQSMAEYIQLGALAHFRRFKDYRIQQNEKNWQPLSIPNISEINVGIMGCGEIGRFVGNKLASMGFRVHGWSRTPQQLDHIVTYSSEKELAKFLGYSNILVCLLPLTAATENILNAKLFDQLPQGAYLINVGRGAHPSRGRSAERARIRTAIRRTAGCVFGKSPYRPNIPSGGMIISG